MALVWKNNKEVDEIKTVIKGKPPRAFIDKVEKWCPFNNAETVGFKKKMSKHLSNQQAIFLINFIEKEMENFEVFNVRDLINKMNANNYTNGDLQRKILSLLVCQGNIKKQMTTYTNKKGDLKFKMIYSFNKNPTPCQYLINDKCNFMWHSARKTRFFTDKKTE